MTTISETITQLNTGAKGVKKGIDALSSQLNVTPEKLDQLNQLINSNKALVATVEEGSQLYMVLQSNIRSII